ncbi:MAG: ABC transporter ATP-binding protein [Phycisphaeraceae bacterium]|nr:ABC transporter ATP-binding protein [Phycisphaeraceae bacterium]
MTDPSTRPDHRHHNVAKTYGRKTRALRGIAMQVHRGEIFGLLGPNGAGKSTLVKILMTVIRPTSCEGRVLGRPVGHKPTLARIGYLPEQHRFPEYLTARQALEFFGALSGVERAVRRRRSGQMLDVVGLSRAADARVRTFSKGMRQRLGVAQALFHEPDLILLDEPTDGVDPEGRREIRAVLQEQKRLGRAVMINSHLLSELEMVCDRAAILVNGSVWGQGTLDELTAYDLRYEVAVATPGAPLDDPAPALATRLTTSGIAATAVRRGVVSLATGNPADVQPVIDAARQAGLLVSAVTPLRPSLEDLFMKAVADGRSGAPVAGRAA